MRDNSKNLKEQKTLKNKEILKNKIMDKELIVLEGIPKEKLIKNLKNSLEKFNNYDKYKHYHANERILKFYKLKLINSKDKLLDDIIEFVSCLESFYSAGLRYEKNKDEIYKMSKFIYDNWHNGLNIKKEVCSENVNLTFVEEFRKEYNEKGRDVYSFITKFFHQFCSDYPINDNKIKTFLKLICPRKNKTSKKNKYQDYSNIYKQILDEIGWKDSVNNFDNAAWILIKEAEDKKKNKKNKKIKLRDIL